MVYVIYGNKWVFIVWMLLGWIDNVIKNYWNFILWWKYMGDDWGCKEGLLDGLEKGKEDGSDMECIFLGCDNDNDMGDDLGCDYDGDDFVVFFDILYLWLLYILEKMVVGEIIMDGRLYFCFN